MAENVFEKMANEGIPAQPEKQPTPTSATPVGEVDYDKFSDTPVGLMKKYERPDLNEQTVTIAKVQLFEANQDEPPLSALKDATKKYYKCDFIIHYETANQDREYISGVRQFVQRDGKTLSPHSFWYEGTETQIGDLWVKVATFKGKKPDELSPREFIAFLNGRPKAVLAYKGFKNPETGATVKKNVVDRFVA